MGTWFMNLNSNVNTAHHNLLSKDICHAALLSDQLFRTRSAYCIPTLCDLSDVIFPFPCSLNRHSHVLPFYQCRPFVRCWKWQCLPKLLAPFFRPEFQRMRSFGPAVIAIVVRNERLDFACWGPLLYAVMSVLAKQHAVETCSGEFQPYSLFAKYATFCDIRKCRKLLFES
jgi:hypothetical protein